MLASEFVFEVVGRSKSDKITKEGNRETLYHISMKTTDGKLKLSIRDNDPDLIARYPLGGEVPVQLDVCTQRTLTDAHITQAVEDAEKAQKEEK